MFKKDDVLVCVDIEAVFAKSPLTLNKEYVARDDEANGYVNVINDRGRSGNFYTRRFVLKAAAKPLKPAKKPNREPGEFLVGDPVIINSNDHADGFNPSDNYDKYVGKTILKAIKVVKTAYYTKLFLDAPGVAGQYVDARQCSLALRKNGQPRVLRKKSVPKFTAAKVIAELDRKCAGIAYNCCSYARMEEDGSVDYSISAACYADLNYAENLRKGKKGLFVNLSAHHRNHPDKKAYEQWVEYILYRSQFRKAFKPSKSKTPWLTSLEMDISYSHSYLITCAIALREGHEYPMNMAVWQDLVAKGYDEDIAWFVSGFIQKNEKKYTLYPANAHTVRNYQMDYTKLLSVLLNDVLPEVKGAKPYSQKDGTRYKIYETLVPNYETKRDKDKVFNKFSNDIPVKLIGEGWNQTKQVLFEDICVFANMVFEDLAVLKANKVDHEPAAVAAIEKELVPA